MANGIVGDAYTHKSTLGALVKRKISMQTAQQQGMSGHKHDKQRDFGGQLVFIKNLQREIGAESEFVRQNKGLIRLAANAEETAIRSIQQQAEKFKVSLVKFNDGIEKDPTPFLDEFRQYMRSVEKAGNTIVGDSYILGGTITNIPPFDLSQIPDGISSLSGPDTGYYNGNTTTRSVSVDTNDNVDFDLNGGHPAFEKLVRAFKIATDPSISSGDDRVKAAQELVDESLNELSALISKSGSKQEGLDMLIEAQEDRLTYLSEKYDELVGADETEVITQFMNDQRILSIMYEMMRHLSEMSLANHWK
jgi:flagellar hook-associated protein 3 FlgL